MNLQNDTPADVGTVVEIQNDCVLVEFSRSEACSTCKLKAFCFQKEGDVTRLTMKNNLDARIGDRIRFEISPHMRVFSSFLVFILPIIFMIGSYFLFKGLCGFSENLSILLSLIAIVVAFVLVKIIDKKISKKALIQPKMVAILDSPTNK